MSMPSRARLRAAALLVTALGLATPGLVPADAAPSTTTGTTAARAATPKLTFAINRKGTVRLTHAPSALRPGRVAYSVTSKTPGASLGFVHFAKGYRFREFRSDLKKSFQGDMKALRRAIAHSTFLGGTGAPLTGTSSGTVVLPKAGSYTVYNFGGNLPQSPLVIKTSGRPQKRPSPKVDGVVKALDGARFGGATTLPHRGTLRFVNTATDSPHFLGLVRVKPGTTAQDILDYLQSGSHEPPAFYLGDGPSTEVVGPGQSMTLNYSAPAGTYAELCFFPDASMGGMPHAAMGMIKIITLT